MQEVTINLGLLKTYVDFIMSFFSGMTPGKGCMEPTISQAAMKKYHGQMILFNAVWVMLQINDFISVDPNGRHFVRLGDCGYEYLHSDEPVPMTVDLSHMVIGRTQEEKSNNLWDMIGPEGCLFYVSGPAYYRTVRGYISGLGPSLSDFIDAEQRKSKNGLKPSRMNYYRSLFMRLNTEQVGYFLDSLSELINGFLDSTKAEQTTEPLNEEDVLNSITADNMIVEKKKVFIVHGHNSVIRERVELLLTQLGFEPIVLLKEASKSQTIIEKIESESMQCCYAVVLYTKCDEGRAMGTDSLQPRARQNVVFEHGYMCAKLGRDHVCALMENGVEQPGDLSGVIYIPFDDNGAWRHEIAKEMRAVELVADANLIK